MHVCLCSQRVVALVFRLAETWWRWCHCCEVNGTEQCSDDTIKSSGGDGGGEGIPHGDEADLRVESGSVSHDVDVTALASVREVTEDEGGTKGIGGNARI